MKQYIFVLTLALWASSLAVPVLAGGIVYMGTDPSNHYSSHPMALTLASNAVKTVGGGSNPNIAYVDTFFGGTGTMLATDGFTNLTSLTPATLATANLSAYQVLYIGYANSASSMVPAAANVLNFVNNGGGLIAENELFDAASWTWLPFGNLIGSSGPTNVAGDNVNIVAPLNPVMAGLTNAGLSNWSFSVHSDFSTPAAAGFTTLAVDANSGIPYIIERVPEPSSLVLAGLGLLSLFLARRWRRAAV